MSNIDTLLERNALYSSESTSPTDSTSVGLKGLLLLTCADSRVDPAYVLGIRPREALILRNPGGRVTPSVIQSLTVLSNVGRAMGSAGATEFVIMHHTDCGLSHLGPEQTPMLGEYFGISQDEVKGKHLDDPIAAVRADIDLLRSNPLVSRSLLVSGLVFDVVTRRVDLVAPPVHLDGDEK